MHENSYMRSGKQLLQVLCLYLQQLPKVLDHHVRQFLQISTDVRVSLSFLRKVVNIPRKFHQK